MTPEQEQRLVRIEALLEALVRSDRYTFAKTVQLMDGRNVQVGKTTGTMFGTETTQKISFLGQTPATRQSAISAPSGGGSGVTDAIDLSARARINDLRSVLNTFGLTA